MLQLQSVHLNRVKKIKATQLEIHLYELARELVKKPGKPDHLFKRLEKERTQWMETRIKYRNALTTIHINTDNGDIWVQNGKDERIFTIK